MLDMEQKRVAVLAEILKGETAADLAKKYDVNPMTIGKWRKEARKKADKEELVELSQVEPEIIQSVIQEVKHKVEDNPKIKPAQYTKIATQLDNLADGVSAIQLLDVTFQTTMMSLLEWAQNHITPDMKPSEWAVLVKGISELHSTVFNKSNGNTVNIMNQNSVGEETSKFKASFRN